MSKYTISVEVDNEILLKIVKYQLNVSELLEKALKEELEKPNAECAGEIAQDSKVINDFTEKTEKFNDC